jgi:hypothetical protein
MAVLVVVGNVLATAFSNFAAPARLVVVDEILGLIPICSGHASESAPNGDPATPPQPGGHCFMCTVLLPLSLALVLLLIGAIAPAARLSRLRRSLERSAAAYRGLAALHSRAPPVFA